MQNADSVHTYAPIGPDRPEPYPDGFIPDANRWSGREYARIAHNDEPSIYGDDAPAGEPAPVDARLTTARTATMVRYIAADRLPARRLIELRHVTHDPGLLALHGERIYGDVPVNPAGTGSPLDPDPWTSPEPRIGEIRVGAILVAFDRETRPPAAPADDAGSAIDKFFGGGDAPAPAGEVPSIRRSTTHVRAWRVPPAGPPILVYHADDPQGDEHLIALSALLDEPLETAFVTLADRYAMGDPTPPDHRILQMRAAIDRWRFADQIRLRNTAPAGNRRRRPEGRKARAARRHAPRPAILVKAA